MAEQSAAAGPGPQAGAPLPAPPEERFWKRYSPHHEFPLSAVGSFALHFLGGGGLIVAALLLGAYVNAKRSPVPLQVAAIAGDPNSRNQLERPDRDPDSRGRAPQDQPRLEAGASQAPPTEPAHAPPLLRPRLGPATREPSVNSVEPLDPRVPLQQLDKELRRRPVTPLQKRGTVSGPVGVGGPEGPDGEGRSRWPATGDRSRLWCRSRATPCGR